MDLYRGVQFDVVQYRLESEYNTRTSVQPLPYGVLRWVTGKPEEIAAMQIPSGRLLRDEHGDPVVAFETRWFADYCRELNPELTFHDDRPVGEKPGFLKNRVSEGKDAQ